LLELARKFPDFVEAEKAGAVRKANTAQELAATMGCSVEILQATLDQVAPEHADGFGRVFKRALQAPYYAVKVTGALFHTQGGLDIDASCRVLREDGRPLPTLLAAGGAARGVSGNEVWGYLSGNGLLSAIGGGWIAAGTAANQLNPPSQLD
jgi:fumarate reductase flavoprotein subunit